MTYATARAAFALALALGLVFATATACDDGGGQCIDNPPKPTVVSVTSLDDDSVRDFDGSCTLSDLSHDGLRSTLVLACPDDGETLDLEIQAVGDSLPPALSVGESYELHLYRGFEIGDPELDLILSDASGPIIAAVDYSYGPVTWGPFDLRFATDCPKSDDIDASVDGFVRFSRDDTRYDVYVGAPELIRDGELSWTAYAGSADDGCCHGSMFSAAMVRL